MAGSAGASESAGADDGGAGAGGAWVVPDGVAISEISFWQALRVPLELKGANVPPNAPLIVNKGGILRVYVAPDEGFQARPLSALLEFGGPTTAQPFESKKLIRGASVDGQFTSTFNFPLDASAVLPNSSYSVTLSDSSDGQVLDRFPKAGRADLGVVSVSPSNALQLMIVPLTVAGIEPDISAPTLATFRARLLAMYPLAEVSISTHARITSEIAVGPEKGWDELLDSLYALRAAETPAANVFYYGLFTPKQSFDDYCVTNCTVGYSIIADADDVDSRGSVGLGIFSDGSNSDAPDTMAHELGHALGRDHAPCDVTLQDSGPFPYPGGKIGVWGFDSLNHSLLDPQAYGDVMGYCSPDWISDFTYRALFERLSSVNAELSAKSLWPTPTLNAYRRVLLRADGSLRWGSRFTPSRVPRGEIREVSLLGEDGSAVGAVAAAFQRFGDAPGGFLLVPEAVLDANSGIAAIRVGSSLLPTR